MFQLPFIELFQLRKASAHTQHLQWLCEGSETEHKGNR